MEQRKRPQPTAEELEVVRAAREYSDTQKRKLVKWFVSKGKPIPTDDQVAALLESRADKVEASKAERREDDRHRNVTLRSNLVAVPAAKHPLYAEEEGEEEEEVSAPPPPQAGEDGAAAAAVGLATTTTTTTAAKQKQQQSPVSFTVPAATSLKAQQHLHSAFAQLCFTILYRQRLETRLSKVAKRQKGGVMAAFGTRGQQQGDGSAASGDGVPVLALVQLPKYVPNLENAETHAAKEAPSATAATELFRPKELKTPFEFKLKDYKQQKFPEHPFANPDSQELAPLLPAGTAEVAEAGKGGAVVPVVDDFQQRIVTLERYPMHDFSFVTIVPEEGLVQGSYPQPIYDSVFCPPHTEIDYDHAVPSLNAPMDVLALELFNRETIPSVKKQRDVDDDLSDSDDDEAQLESAHPKSLEQVVTQWMPPVRSMAATIAAAAQQQQQMLATGGTTATATATAAADQQQQQQHDEASAPNLQQQQPATSLAQTQQSQQHVDPASLLLNGDVMPVQKVGDEIVNRDALRRRNALLGYVDSVRKALPLPMQKPF